MAILKSKQARPGYAAGIFSDMTLDGPEIGTLVAVIDRAKNLPNRKTIGKQDPYCAMRLGKEAKKTDTDRRGGQTPKWDQELRFTVHDSPDYYKLKCSVFNDDKRTDLIGESWIDLTDVIKLGGGQSDIWHQLSFKGKYAGEVRVELTFYDSREKPIEKKKLKEPHETSPSESASDLSLSAPRSLGPREIKRRPLPTNPAVPAPAPLQTKSITIESSKPSIPPKVPHEKQPLQSHHQLPQPQTIHAPVPTRPRGSSVSPQPQQQYRSQQYEEHDQYAPQDQNIQQAYYQQRQLTQVPHTDQVAQLQPQQRQQSWHETTQSQYHDVDQQYYARDSMPARIEHNPYSQPPQQQMRQSPMSAYSDEHEIWQNQRPQSIHTHSAPITPHDSPAHRPLPSSTNSDGQLVRYQQQQHRADPTLSRAAHADSPLRHSMSHQEVGLPLVARSTAPPPLPPKHRDTPPHHPKTEHLPSAYMPQPLRVSGNRFPTPERSPLQSSEDEYSMHRQERFVDRRTPQRHSMYDAQYEQRYESPQQYEQPGQLELYGRRRTYDEHPRFSDPQIQQPMQQSFDRSHRNSYDNRNPTYNRQVTQGTKASTPRDSYHSGHEDGYQPFVEDAPPSPGLQPALSRKPVGAQPKALTGVPFGPDAYDVLNPASSPVTNVNTKFQTPEQVKEAERLKEVAKIRELGPIIGNDGRVIDPSDHLPSDTWAPEPERKNRKPEHVVHIRSKNDPKRPAGARGSPLIAKHNGPQSVYNSVAPAPTSSPLGRTPPNNFAGGRNRLQKSMPTPTRGLPNQPYSSPVGPAVASSPALASSPQDMYENRRPSYDNRSPSHLSRPPLSEYQVPAGNSYAPRTKSYEREPQKVIEPAYETPSKQPSYQAYASPAVGYERRNSYDNRASSQGHRNSDYAYDAGYYHDVSPSQHQRTQHYDDPLAAEMSLIDIGPSRNGQSPGYNQGAMVRSRGRWQ